MEYIRDIDYSPGVHSLQNCKSQMGWAGWEGRVKSYRAPRWGSWRRISRRSLRAIMILERSSMVREGSPPPTTAMIMITDSIFFKAFPKDLQRWLRREGSSCLEALSWTDCHSELTFPHLGPAPTLYSSTFGLVWTNLYTTFNAKNSSLWFHSTLLYCTVNNLKRCYIILTTIYGLSWHKFHDYL